VNKLDMVQCEGVDGGLLRELPSIASQISARLLSYRRHIRELEIELDREQTARVLAENVANEIADAPKVTRARETIDGVECERISGLDVIVPAGLIPDGEEPKEVRSYALPFPLRWILEDGAIEHPELACGSDGTRGELTVLLADKPAPAPTPTWAPPDGFADGEYYSFALSLRLANGVHQIYHEHLGILCPGYTKPAPGRWQVKSGRATYIDPNKESPQ